MSQKIEAGKYISMYGPTVGDKVRLGDTDLFIEVEKDYTVYGDECKFGGGKSLRNGMGQSATGTSKGGDLDLVITNALILDYWGIVKADIGIKDGKIVGIGKAGNPDIMDGVDHTALYSGVTTMIGGGVGPSDGSNATTCTPGPWNMERMLEAAEEYPMNLGFYGKGNCSTNSALAEQILAGAVGLKTGEQLQR